MKIQLPRTPQADGERRSLFDSMETDDAEDSLAAKIRPKLERRKLKSSSARRRPKPPPLRPQSATEITQRPRIRINNPIDLEGDDDMETSLASTAPALTSIASNTGSALSFSWVCLLKNLIKILFNINRNQNTRKL